MKLKLVKIIDETQDVKSFFWESETEIKFTAGQYFYFTLPNLKYPDERGATRPFTLSNSPTEKVLRLTTKFPTPMSGYKQTLLDLKVGDVVEGRGPVGTFTLGPTSPRLRGTKNILFFAGGIGITPFRSIVKYNFDNKLELPYLIYSNSDENFVFGDELKTWLGEKVSFVDTSKSGHIDALKLNNLISNHLISAHFYVVGPPKFVDSIESSLEQLDVRSDKIVTEKFTGY